MKINSQKQRGFTLIEMIVSLGLFSIVVTIAVGALLVLITTNQQLQAEQSVMTNLSFAIDSMSREIRTGTDYYCVSRPNYDSGSGEAVFDNSNDHENLDDGHDDCDTGAGKKGSGMKLKGISFKEGGESLTSGAGERVLYFYDNVTGSLNQGKIMRRVGNGPAQSIVSSGIYIKDAEFYVTGSAPLSSGAGQQDQATVTIFIEAAEKLDATKTYKIQTTITQRTLDI